MKHLSVAFVVALSLFTLACDDGPSSEPITAGNAATVCREICEHDASCGGTDPIDACTDDCVNEITGWVRSDAAEELAACTAATACGASDDPCIAMIEPLAIHFEWEDACRAQLATCDLDLDVCAARGQVALFAPVVVDAMIACLGGADCAARQACLEAVFTQFNIDL